MPLGSTLAAWAFRYSRGEPFVYPRNDLSYAENFLHMLFAKPSSPYRVDPVLAKVCQENATAHKEREGAGRV